MRLIPWRRAASNTFDDVRVQNALERVLDADGPEMYYRAGTFHHSLDRRRVREIAKSDGLARHGRAERANVRAPHPPGRFARCLRSQVASAPAAPVRRIGPLFDPDIVIPCGGAVRQRCAAPLSSVCAGSISRPLPPGMRDTSSCCTEYDRRRSGTAPRSR
jgi:hypothetical protein